MDFSSNLEIANSDLSYCMTTIDLGGTKMLPDIFKLLNMHGAERYLPCSVNTS